MNGADKQLADGLVSLGMEPAQAVAYAAEHSAEPQGRKASSLGERLYAALRPTRPPFHECDADVQALYERAAVSFTASLTYAESEGVREALLSSLLLGALENLVHDLAPLEFDDDFGAARHGGPDPDAPRKAYYARPTVKAAMEAIAKAQEAGRA